MSKEILVPVDFSELSSELVDYALEYARLLNAKIILVYVIQSTQLVEILGTVETGIPVLTDPGIIEQIKQGAEARLKEYQERIQAQGIEVESHILTGIPYLEITQFAGEQGVDLIIIASHSRSSWRQFLLGSVTAKVAQKSPVPVLIYKPKKTESQPKKS